MLSISVMLIWPWSAKPSSPVYSRISKYWGEGKPWRHLFHKEWKSYFAAFAVSHIDGSRLVKRSWQQHSVRRHPVASTILHISDLCCKVSLWNSILQRSTVYGSYPNDIQKVIGNLAIILQGLEVEWLLSLYAKYSYV